jgi:hypothetical protein
MHCGGTSKLHLQIIRDHIYDQKGIHRQKYLGRDQVSENIPTIGMKN